MLSLAIYPEGREQDRPHPPLLPWVGPALGPVGSPSLHRGSTPGGKGCGGWDQMRPRTVSPQDRPRPYLRRQLPPPPAPRPPSKRPTPGPWGVGAAALLPSGAESAVPQLGGGSDHPLAGTLPAILPDPSPRGSPNQTAFTPQWEGPPKSWGPREREGSSE